MEDLRKTYHSWLRDAHAMEEQAETMLSGMLSRLENYPELSARIRDHIVETQGQAEALRRLLEERETSSSLMKDAIGKMTAMGQAMSGIFTSDEVVKGTMASYTFEHMEIAAYVVLIAAAEQLGDHAAIPVYERILAEERAMADWLAENAPETTRRFLLRDAADLQAKR